MKKALSILLSICMLLSITVGVNVTANAATNINNQVINTNVEKIKKFIKTNGFVNGNGNYTFQEVVYDDNGSDDSYFLMIVDSSTNELTFEMQSVDSSTDEVNTVLELDLSSPKEEIKYLGYRSYRSESDYPVLTGHAYLPCSYYHLTNNASYYIDYNYYNVDKDIALNLFSAETKFAFDVWNDILGYYLNLNLGAVGFYNYCSSHIWNSGKITKKATTSSTGVKTYTCTLCGATKTSKIAKNTFTAKGLKKTVKSKTVNKGNVSFKRAKVITIKNAKGKVTYKKAKGNKKIVVSKSGKLTVKKGLAKGTYKIKVKVTAAGNTNYNKETKTVTVTITVK